MAGNIARMKSPLKQNPVQVLLSDEELELLDRLVGRTIQERQDATIGRGTLLRELGMVRVRELLVAEAGVP